MFRELIYTNTVIVYVNDIIIESATREHGIEQLRKVLAVEANSGIEDGTIKPTDIKLKAVLNYPTPTNVKNIQCFLGLTGYFRKFIEGYPFISTPLSNLLQKDKPFVFGQCEQNAFDTLKNKLIKPPVLHFYQPNCETELHTDASKDVYGAILMQKCPDTNALHPTYFYSKKTLPNEKTTQVLSWRCSPSSMH